MKDLLTGPALNLNGIARAVFSVNTKNGWYENGVPTTPEQIALIHSEASEMLEADRRGRHARADAAKVALQIEDDVIFRARFEMHVKDTLGAELADVIIRALDFAAARDIDINSHVLAGIRYNSMRGHKHGGKEY